MRRSLFALLTVIALVSLGVMTGCDRTQTLRVVTVNHGALYDCDIADWWLFVDPLTKDSEEVYSMKDDTVPVELQYVEVGPGLPTWTPYQAIANKATITYKSSDPTITYDNVTIPLSVSVPADQSGKKTTKFALAVVPLWWKEKYFDGDVSDPTSNGIIDVVNATIKITATDSISGEERQATGYLQIEVADFQDDPRVIGR